MRITEKVTETREVTRLKDIVCNGCAQSCALPRGQPDHMGYHGLIEATVTGAFASTHLEDMRSYRFSLCEACLAALFERFQLPPETDDDGSAS